MLEPLFALLRRRRPGGGITITDVEPGRARLVGAYEEPISAWEIAEFRRRYIEIPVACQYGRPSTATDPTAERLFREFMRQREVLAELVTLERYRDRHGPDGDYERCMRLAWARALALVPDETSN